MTSPTQRTMDKLRADGWECQNVEKFNHHTKRRQDLFGCIDIVAIREGATLGIQCTSGSNTSSRVHKIAAEPRMVTWLKAGNLLEVWGWRQLVAHKKDGTKAKRPKWEPRIERVTLEQLEPPAWQVALDQVRDATDQAICTLTRKR